MEIKLADQTDLTDWMLVVEKVKDVFPGLDTMEEMAQHKKTVQKFMENGEAICAKLESRIAGEIKQQFGSSVQLFILER